MKALGYIRVSTETQVREGQGLDVQRDQIEKYCKFNKLDLLGIYEDRGVSGAKADEENLTVDREGLQDMLADIPALDIERVVVANTSRLWRSDMVKVLIQRQLKRHKVDVRAVDQPTYSIYSQDDPSQFLINGLMELLDQHSSLEIALKLKRGRRRKAKNGGFAGGKRALGYKKILIEDKPDLAIDEDEAETIILIRKLRREGLSMQAIADKLNGIQAPTKRGGKWYASTIQYILNNKLYKGIFEYNSTRSKRADLAIR